MINFDYSSASSPEEALALMRRAPGSRIIAGGTDLLPLMKEEIVTLRSVIDISAWRAGSRIELGDSGLHIGALTSLADIASYPVVKAEYKALADACSLAATPQLRNMGTIGGNLLQQTRCWYYRGPYHCWLKGGDTCYAREGENEYHSIFATAPTQSMCVSAHPSDPAAALLALDARVRFRTAASPDRDSEIGLTDFYRLPSADRRGFTVLADDAIMTELVVPPTPAEGRSSYSKVMVRASWAFALAGLALYLEVADNSIETARVALSGVAPIPLRAEALEAWLLGKATTDVDLDAAAALLIEGAHPLRKTRYKLQVVKGLLKQALPPLLNR